MEFIKEFKSKSDWMARLSKSQSLRKKYPNKVPVIVDRGNTQIDKLKNHKYLVPGDLTVGGFLQIIRKNIKLSPEQALFIFVGDGQTLPATGALMSQIYKEQMDRDGYMYLCYCSEQTYGDGYL